jgi:hypothetical protein
MQSFIINLKNTQGVPPFQVYNEKLIELINNAMLHPTIDFELIILGGIYLGGPISFMLLNKLLTDRSIHMQYTVTDKNYKPLCSGNKLPNNIKTVIVSII